jgi:sugar phosphate isomerase/epimerase
MSKIPIGLQLYSIRHDCERDLPGTLSKVAEMGYDGVEFAGYYGYDAESLREILDDLGLACCGTHARWDSLQPEMIEETIAFNQTLGNQYLIVPALPEERRSSRQAWLETAAMFNEIAATLTEYGMYTGYHNHFVEFQPLDGELPWDTLFSNTRKDVVMQIDTGNARHGGGDPLLFLARYPGRALTVHLKEYSETDDTALVGDGDENWPKFFQLCELIGATRWYIVEYEKDVDDRLAAVAGCVRNLRDMGK